jgi:hypothetical protein
METRMVDKNAKDTSGRDFLEINQEPSLVSGAVCECGGEIYYDTGHIIIFGDFERSAHCNRCDNRFKIISKGRGLSRTTQTR